MQITEHMISKVPGRKWKRMVSIHRQACTGCGLCVESCPTFALHLIDGAAQIDEYLCKGCEICVDVCPQGAITSSEVIEKTYPVVVKAKPLSGSAWDKENVLDHATVILPTLHSAEALTKPKRSLSEWLGAALVFLVRDLTPAMENLLRLKKQYKEDATYAQPHFVESVRVKGSSGRRSRQRVRRRRRRRR